MIKKISEFDCIFKNKQSVGNRYFSIYYMINDQEHYKYAISIGRKYGKAHERNLMKRRLRHIVYNLSNNFSKNLNFIIVVKPTSKKLDFDSISNNITYLINKISVKEKDKI